MNVCRPTERSSLVGQLCLHCGKRVQAGEDLIARRSALGEAPGYMSYFVLHVACARILVERAPKELFEIEYEKERERILATGELWPSTSN